MELFERKVGAKERDDAAAGVEGSRLVVRDAGEAQGLEENALVIVHEGMGGVRVFLHVVGDEGVFQRALKLIGDALVPAVLGAVAGHDGAGSSKEVINVCRQFPSIVDAGSGETAV